MSTTFDIHRVAKGRGLQRNGFATLLLAGALLVGPTVLLAGEDAGSGEQADQQVSEEQVNRGQRIWERISQRYDQNQDGQVTQDEAPAERFSRMDRNSDGVVTEADFENFEGRKGRRGPGRRGMAKVVAAADADQDGKVTQAEWSTFVDGIDADNDGLLTEEELTAHREAHRKAKGIESSEGLEKQRRGRHHKRVFMDTDEDGQLETEDLLAVFSKLDRNGDGELSRADRPVRDGKRARHRFRGHRIAGHLMRQADINADEQLSQSEWTGYLATLDSNTDGLLSREELEAARPEDAPERPHHADRGEPKPLEIARLTEMFTRRDADANGVIEGDEWNRRGPRGHRGSRGRAPVGEQGASL